MENKNNGGVYLLVGTVLVVGAAGFAWWYTRKQKKKEKQSEPEVSPPDESPQAPSPPQSSGGCKSYSYPLSRGTCHKDVRVLQKYLKSLGADIGRSGRTKDGVDGQMGDLTSKAARSKLGKESFTPADILKMKQSLKS